MTCTLANIDLRRNLSRLGWFTLRRINYAYYPPQEFSLLVSPKLRLFEYLGGPAAGQISKREFNRLLFNLERYEKQQVELIEESLPTEDYDHEFSVDLVITKITL